MSNHWTTIYTATQYREAVKAAYKLGKQDAHEENAPVQFKDACMRAFELGRIDGQEHPDVVQSADYKQVRLKRAGSRIKPLYRVQVFRSHVHGANNSPWITLIECRDESVAIMALEDAAALLTIHQKRLDCVKYKSSFTVSRTKRIRKKKQRKK